MLPNLSRLFIRKFASTDALTDDNSGSNVISHVVGFVDPYDLKIVKDVRPMALVTCKTEIFEINYGLPPDRQRVHKWVKLPTDVPFEEAIVKPSFLTLIYDNLVEITKITIGELQPLCVQVAYGYFGSILPQLDDTFEVAEGDEFKTHQADHEFLELLRERALKLRNDKLDREEKADGCVRPRSTLSILRRSRYYADERERDRILIDKEFSRLKESVADGLVLSTSKLPVVLKRATVTFLPNNRTPSVLFKAIKQIGESSPIVTMDDVTVNLWREHQKAIMHAPIDVRNGLKRLKETATPWRPSEEDREWWPMLSQVCTYFRDKPPTPLPDDMAIFQGKELPKPHPSKEQFDGYTCFFDPYTTSPLVARGFERKFGTHFFDTTIGRLRSDAAYSNNDFVALWLSKNPFPIPKYMRDYLNPVPELEYEYGDRKEYEILCISFPKKVPLV